MAVKKKTAKKKAVKKSVGRKKVTKKLGRPSDFTPELGMEICCRMMAGNSLRKVCAADDMPSKTAVFHWLAKGDSDNPDAEYKIFRDQYARACELRREFRFEQLEEELEDKVMTPLMVDGLPLVLDGEVVKTMTAQSVQFGRLMLDAFKWQASKENPKKYGEKVQTEHSGTIGLTNILDEIDGNQTGLPDGSPD